MFTWLNNIVRGVLQEGGYIRSPQGIILPDEMQERYRGGVQVNKETFLAIPAVKRAVEIITNKVANCRCHVLKILASGGREFDKKHAAYKLLRKRANPYLAAIEFIKTLVQDAIWAGNAYAFIQKKAGEPDALYILDPDTVTPAIIHTATTQQMVYVVRREGQTIALDASEVIHIRSALTRSCGLVGMRLIDLCRENISLHISEARYATKFFEAGGIADAWIEVPEGAVVDEETLKAFKVSLNRLFSGIENSRSAVALTGGAKLNKTYLSNGDSQLLESRTFSLIDIANLCGIDPSFIGGQTNTSYSSLESINTAALSNSFGPWLSVIEAEFSYKLLRTDEQDDYYIEFDRNDLTKGDATAETAVAVMRVSNALQSWEEYRFANNLPVDNKETDTFWRPSNLVDAFAEPPAPAASPFGAPQPPQNPASEDQTGAKSDASGEVIRGKLAEITERELSRLINRLRKDAPASKDALFASHHHVFSDALPGAEMFIERLFLQIGEELGQVLPEQRAAVYARLDARKLAGAVWNH
ncbi:phage portal protein [Anatilimnocola floriformis]|uniref:phage portal protein n=1 Tax=Anatilimnocola floriformis TaxID=2948575 RepID=UPI0020C2566B|nr:phage portal protein [Anatilimnocola floriformis]